ncbi:MAG TPA: hypothetical protein VL325_00895 [Pyrinomonadaceae bacterium]|nr:hypothetical protein [Pyrinomonadaceae bacterium]
MNAQSDGEIWQVEVNGEVYQADFTELASWVADGALQPDDKVRRGNLRWIEAGKVPFLTAFFNAKATGQAPPTISVSVPEPPEEIPSPAVAESFSNVAAVIAEEPVVPAAHPKTVQRDPKKCAIHADVDSFYTCVSCEGKFCKACPSGYGGSVKICPTCGGLCKSITEVLHAEQAKAVHNSAVAGGFGFSDFSEALAYPLKFKTSLSFGAVMFMFFTLGQSAVALGGIFMLVAAIFCFMLANMLTFGVLANTVENFAQGKIGGNFMPSFDEFSIWDDVVHPFFLSIGAYISSFGPFILVVAIGMYFVISAAMSQSQAIQTDIEKIPGTHYYDAQRTMKQSERVKDLLGKTAEQNEQRLKQQELLENDQTPVVTNPEDTEADVARANETIQKMQKSQLESAVGKSPETRQKENEQLIKNFFSLAAPLVILAAILFFWGVFYFPAACAVAGYTRSFFATINPLVGLDTIKRLGGDYVKILLMCFALIIMSGIVGGLFSMIFAPFDLPGFGNMPAKAIGALFGFYFSVVFSCVLGFALYKASNRLKLYR